MDNIIVIDGNVYKSEKVWRDHKGDMTRDSKGMIFPYPVTGIKWPQKIRFINRLKIIHRYLDRKKKFKMYEKYKHCLICGKKNITTRRYLDNGIIWEDGLIHYIEVHNIEPSLYFKRYIYNSNIIKKIDNDKKLLRSLYAEKIRVDDKEYVMIEKNQLLILDALMVHGGYVKKYYDNEEYVKRYSEHAGSLDFEGNQLNKIIVYGKSRIDEGDDEIYLPPSVDDMLNYEYIFHTHPPTPGPGGRARDGILYELPTMGDIYHFIDSHNDGRVIGSLVITAEGLYNIRKKDNMPDKISIDENGLFRDYEVTFDKIQERGIAKYGDTFSDNYFYSTIAQDVSFIGELNGTLNKYNIQIDYYPRKQNKDNKDIWYIDTLFLVFTPRKI